MGRNPTEARHGARRHSSNMNSAPASAARHRNTKTGQGRHLATTQAGHRHPPGAPASGGRRARRGEGEGSHDRRRTPPPPSTRHNRNRLRLTARPPPTKRTQKTRSANLPGKQTRRRCPQEGRRAGGGRQAGEPGGERTRTDKSRRRHWRGTARAQANVNAAPGRAAWQPSH